MWMFRRPLFLSIAFVALVALSALYGCGGGGESAPPPASRAEALSVSKPGEWVESVRGVLRARLAERQRNGSVDLGLAPSSTVGLGSATAAPPERSTTLTQEEGVGEADLLVNATSHLFSLQPDATPLKAAVSASRRNADGSLTSLPSLVLDAEKDAGSLDLDGLHASNDFRSLAAVTQQWIRTGDPCGSLDVPCIALPAPPFVVWMRSEIALHWIDAARPEALRAAGRISIDGSLVDTRRIGDTMVVVSHFRPQLDIERLPLDAPASQRETMLAALKPELLLPTMRIDGGASQPLVRETDCWLQPTNKSLDISITTVSLFDLKNPGAPRLSRCFVGGTEALYMSAANLYLATTRTEAVPAIDVLKFPADFKTDVHKFAVSATDVAYRASGTVDGHLGWQAQRRPWRFSELGGDLRVLTFTGSVGWLSESDAGTKPPSPATLTVLREEGDRRLVAVSTLPNAKRPEPLGKPGEQVFGVRFAGDRGYVVTFRRIDPLYVLDLSAPSDPRIAGQLEVPGFSDHLQPLPGGLLFGVGRDVDANGRIAGLKMSLFDVRDAAAPREVSSLRLGGALSSSALDFHRHGLNFMVRNEVARIAVPVFLMDAGGGPGRHGLQRMEVPLSGAPALRDRGLIDSPGDGSRIELWLERSAQIDDNVYYLSQRALSAHRW